ncbi:MAG: hypothetical protein COW04_06090, partial [Deltaproteobacteria bacterium CG12_big_fil_rev_8_21_14_0_65_43_10]
MKPFNILIIISLIIIFGSFVFFKNGFNNSMATKVQTSELRMDMLNYLDYSDGALANTQRKGKSVLFFAATTWCQTCSALEEEIIERQAEIPEGVTILKVDYDNDKAMNQKYGVTSQHTLVVLDENGKELKRWLGGGFDTLLQQ